MQEQKPTIHCNLRKLMYERKIRTISALVRLTGVSRIALSKLYDEKELSSIKVETYIKVCDGFGCSLHELLEYN